MFTAIDHSVTTKLKQIFNQEILNNQSQTKPQTSCLAGSLGISLCYINKFSKSLQIGFKLNSRILVLHASEDQSSQYLPVMNCIYAAEKLVCKHIHNYIYNHNHNHNEKLVYMVEVIFMAMIWCRVRVRVRVIVWT